MRYALRTLNRQLEKRREAKVLAIDDVANTVLAGGAPFAGLHVSLDVSSRADLSGMATTATAAMAGAVSWPESYATGWIAIENERIPMPTAEDGIAVAAAAGEFYAHVRQNARDLKDEVLAAETMADLNEIDINSGWPE